MKKRPVLGLLMAAALAFTTLTAGGMPASASELSGETLTEEETSAEELLPEGMAAETSVIEESAAEDPAAEEIVIEESLLEETSAEESTSLEEIAEEADADATEDGGIISLQEMIGDLPAPEEYDHLSRSEKREMVRQMEALKENYYEAPDEERSLVDASHLFALDLYAKTYAYYSTEEEYAGQLTLEDVETHRLSVGALGELQRDIRELPELAEVTDVSGIGTNGRPAALSYEADPERVYLTDTEVDRLYEEVYDAAETYYTLAPEQAMEVEETALSDLVSYFSVGVAYYDAGSGGIGEIDAYSMQRYSGKLASSTMKFGYYQVSTENSDGSRIAFCMDSNLYSPGREGTTLVAENECTSEVIRTIMYYGYGGPGELVAHDLNGYCETHMAICHAVDGKSVNRALSSAAYKKLYTNVPDKSVASGVRAWSVSSVTAGRQPLVYAIFDEEKTPETQTLHLRLQKGDGDTLLPEAQGTAALSGAVFALEYLGEPAACWYYRTDAEGKIDVEDRGYLMDLSDAERSEPLPVNDAGILCWPAGEYRIREVRPPEFYRLEGTMHFAGAEKSAPVAEGLTFRLEAGAEADFTVLAYDLIHKGKVTVNKLGQGRKPLAGVTYRLESSAGDREPLTVITGEDGIARFEGLIPGTYRLTEVSATPGYELFTESIDITLPYVVDAEDAVGADGAYYDEASELWCFDEVSFEITDDPRLPMPMTGGSGSGHTGLLVLALLAILAGLFRLTAAPKEGHYRLYHRLVPMAGV